MKAEAASAVRERVLRGIALNREPGYHFPANFLEVSFDWVRPEDTRLSLEPGPHCIGADGQVHFGALAFLADLALAATIRARLDPATRLATTNIQLQFTGAPRSGRLETASHSHGFLQQAAGRQGLSRVTLSAAGRLACFGTGAFMVLDPPKGVKLHPVRHQRGEPAVLPEEAELPADERLILKSADTALSQHGAFIDHFWGALTRRTATGASSRIVNSPHIGNRVGHVQGGLILGYAAQTAATALPPDWELSSISACYLSPGEGAALNVASKIVHHGRLTAVVRTEVNGPQRKRVLEVLSTHARR